MPQSAPASPGRSCRSRRSATRSRTCSCSSRRSSRSTSLRRWPRRSQECRLACRVEHALVERDASIRIEQLGPSARMSISISTCRSCRRSRMCYWPTRLRGSIGDDRTRLKSTGFPERHAARDFERFRVAGVDRVERGPSVGLNVPLYIGHWQARRTATPPAARCPAPDQCGEHDCCEERRGMTHYGEHPRRRLRSCSVSLPLPDLEAVTMSTRIPRSTPQPRHVEQHCKDPQRFGTSSSACRPTDRPLRTRPRHLWRDRGVAYRRHGLVANPLRGYRWALAAISPRRRRQHHESEKRRNKPRSRKSRKRSAPRS